jgi:hypothetical protein
LGEDGTALGKLGFSGLLGMEAGTESGGDCEEGRASALGLQKTLGLARVRQKRAL